MLRQRTQGQDARGAKGIPKADPVWTYRGYRLQPREFTTAMVHLYRAEVQRANAWRQRLDTTTNWAVVTTGAAISFTFGRTLAEDHRLILLDVLLVTLFLWIEASRYRLILNVSLLLIGLLTASLQEATGEVLPRYSGLFTRHPAGHVPDPSESHSKWWHRFRNGRDRPQPMAYIVSDNGEAISQRIMRELRRRVTVVPGTGMYTHRPHSALMCALTAKEVAHLKAVVRAEDSEAFMIVSSAAEVLGNGFQPLCADT